MTTVHISLGRDDGTDQTAAKGVVEWEPTTRREDGTMVILERGFTVPLVAGEATVTVDPSGLTWCWRVTERTDSGGTVRYVSVPDSATTVEYVDLPDVDPTTLVAWSPADPEAAYLAAIDGLVGTAVDEYLAENPISAPVTSVNGEVGAVVLDAADVGADPAGTAVGLVGALEIPDSADDVGAIPEPAVEGASGDVLVTDGAGGRTWATPDAGGVTSVDGQTGAVSLSSTYAAADADAASLTSGAALDGQVLTADGLGQAAWETPASGVTDHGLLAGLADDDHTQYALADGTRGSFAPPLGADDNYVTGAEKAALHSHSNKAALDSVSGTNTGDQDLSGLVPKSLVDAKGDLLVGTAADAVGRLAVGTDGQVLTADAASAGGVKWAAAASPGHLGNQFVVASGNVMTGPKLANSNARLDTSTPYGTAYPAPVSLIHGIEFYVGTPATGTVHVGVYNSNANGYPVGAPIYESDVGVTTTGWKAVAFTAIPTGPLLWVFFTTTDIAVRLGGYNNNSTGPFLPLQRPGGESPGWRIEGFVTDPTLEMRGIEWSRQPTFNIHL